MRLFSILRHQCEAFANIRYSFSISSFHAFAIVFVVNQIFSDSCSASSQGTSNKNANIFALPSLGLPVFSCPTKAAFSRYFSEYNDYNVFCTKICPRLISCYYVRDSNGIYIYI